MTEETRRILIIAGEASGDLHGSELIRAMKERSPNYEFYGLGGKRMRARGADTFFDIERMGTVGIIEVLGESFHYWNVYKRLRAEIESGRYDAAILIDYPTLNMRLARLCRENDIPVYYVIGPQIWAWRAGRIKAIKRDVSKMFVIFPFEEALYRDAGVDVEFVGHPFAEKVRPTMSREEALRHFGLREDSPVVGLLPGSRKNEIDSLFDVMLKGSADIAKERPDCQFLLPVADTLDPEPLRKRAQESGLDIRVVPGQSYDVMNCSDCLVIASGSATLEAALIGTPMVIVYKLNPLTYWLAKPLVKIDLYGLANIAAGEKVVPELIQYQLTRDAIKKEVERFLAEPEYVQSVKEKLSHIKATLGQPGVMERIATSVCQSLEQQSAAPTR
ncbi:MAG: lipid-A-disaccharide synthase [Candidatus Nitrohelix vancouverensis]|uniref:Lipid-A-disaccharide synthase n=1 Tax=Candidatus Nitrohelix vancouverensis TaxID=2705534 RepID=A0A7T0G230_9BACT|nr:MAG: lipid-A-disaccharide synthase [Candidatus Nitrohelix vancouverensis]